MLLARDGTKYGTASYITVYSGIREHNILHIKYSELSERKLSTLSIRDCTLYSMNLDAY
jgi:hypothetical protein